MIIFFDLNARHVATLLWVAFPLTVALILSSQCRSSIRRILADTADRRLMLILAGMLSSVMMLTALAVILGRLIIGLFETLPVVSAIFWYLASGGLLIAGLDHSVKLSGLIRSKIQAALIPSAIAALFSVSILPLWQELLLVPTLFAQAWVSQFHSSRFYSRFGTVCLIVSILVLLVAAIHNLFGSPETLSGVDPTVRTTKRPG